MVNINDFRPIKLWNKVLLKNNKVRLVGKDGTAWKPAQSTDLHLPANVFEPKLLHSTANLTEIKDFFNYFISDDIVNKIVLSTNQRIQGKELTALEFRAFCGVLLLFGVTKKHDVEINEIYTTQSVNFSEWAAVCMSRNRLKEICSKICFDDLATRTDPNRFNRSPKFFKMIDVFEIFKSNLNNGLFEFFDLF